MHTLIINPFTILIKNNIHLVAWLFPSFQGKKCIDCRLAVGLEKRDSRNGLSSSIVNQAACFRGVILMSDTPEKGAGGPSPPHLCSMMVLKGAGRC